MLPAGMLRTATCPGASPHEAMLTFTLLNGGAVLAAFVVAAQLGLRERASALLLGTASGYLVLVHSSVLLAGLLGYLTTGVLATLVTAVVLAAAWWARSLRRAPPLSPEPARVTAASLFAPLAAITAGAAWAWPHLFDATRLWVWDDYTYHMVYPALWLRDHTIVAATPAQAFTMQAWYPLSASVVATWFMVPFSGARAEALAWVSLTGLLYAGIVGGGTGELCRRLGCRRWAWAVPVGLFATSHRTAIMAGGFSDADLAQAASLFGAFAFAIPRGDVEASRDIRVDAWYAGLLTGLALGMKVSAAPQALVVLLVIALRARALGAHRGERMRAVVGVGLVFALCWAATGGYWYARNLIHTGNPVYPAAFLTWPGTTFPETTLLEYARRYGVRRTMADALAVYTNWPSLHAWLAIIGLVGLPAWYLARRRSLTRPQRYYGWATLAVAAAVLVLLPAAPFSAGNALTFRSGFVHWDSMRYVAILLLLGWAALGVLVDAGGAPVIGGHWPPS